MRYYYEAVDGAGQRTSGSLDSESEDRVAEILERKGLVPVRIGKDRPQRAATAKRGPGLLGGSRVTNPQRILLVRQLATLLGASCPMDRAFEMMLQRSDSVAMEKLCREMKEAVEGGKSLSQSMADHPEVFSGMHVGMAAAGDEGGFLATALGQMAEYEENQARLRSQIVHALTYPAFMIGVMVISCAVLFKYVVPSILEVVLSTSTTLPLPTRVLVAISDATSRYAGHAVAATVALAWGLRSWIATPGGRRTADRLRLVAPIVGGVTRQVVVARVCRILSMLLAGGVNMVRSLEIAAGTAQNVMVEADVAAIRQKVQSGDSLSACMEASEWFPPYVASMVQLGEESGKLDQMLARVSTEFEEDYQNRLKGAVALVEPMMIAVMGLVVGFVVVSVFLPMTQMSSGV